MFHLLRKIISDCYPDIVGNILTCIITIWCVFFTVKNTRKDTDRMIMQSKNDTDRTLKDSEKSSKELLYATVKPILYSLNLNMPYAPNNKHTPEKIVEFNAEDTFAQTFSFISYMKNSNNGIAIIKKITFSNIDYTPDIDCVIDKGSIVEIIVNSLDGTVKSLNGTMEVYDIYGNPYNYPITIHNDKFFANNSSLMKDLQQNSKSNVNVKTGDISNGIVAVGDNINVSNNK